MLPLSKRSLDIYLFSSCRSARCNEGYQLLMKRLGKSITTLSSMVPVLHGKEIHVVLCGQGQIKRMNEQFRGEDVPTDVLSFMLDEQITGEVWICPDVILSNAKRFGERFDHELVRVLVHGVLHIAQFDHTGSFRDSVDGEEPMFALQERVVSGVFSQSA